MSSSSKRLSVVAALLSLLAFGLSAQEAAPASPTGPALLSFELGAVGGYTIGGNDAICGRSFGFDLSVTDKLAVGYANTLVTTTTYNFAHLGYAVMPALGVDLYAGSNTAGDVAVGLGASYAIFQSKAASGLSNALKGRIDYLFDVTNGIDNGEIVASVVASVGL